MYSAAMGYCWVVEEERGLGVVHSAAVEMAPDWEEAGV